MKGTMKAAVIRLEGGEKVLRLEDVPEPVCGDQDVLVRVSYVGVCGSDLHAFVDPSDMGRPPGLIMGHEPSGEVAAVGVAVKRVTVGDRVTIDPQITCGTCWPCSQGWISICDNNKKVTGGSRGVQGAMAEFVCVSERQVFPVPANVSLEEAAMIEPLANALHVVNRAEVAPGDVVVVLGAGPIGLCLVQCLRAVGADPVVVSEVAKNRRKIAEDLGATRVVDPRVEDLTSVVSEVSGGRGADVVIESVGIDATYQQALEIARKRGKVAFFGAIQPTVVLPLLTILWKELSLIGCTGANTETLTAIDRLAAGQIKLAPILTHRFPLSRANEAMESLADPDSGAIKVLVSPLESD